MLLLIIAFIGGVLTVLAPCILPLLPVIVGGSLSDGTINKKKALTVVVSLGVSVIVFTLLLKVSTLFITIPEYSWKLISGGIILVLGIVTLFPILWENQMIARLSSKSNMLLGKGNQKNSFWGDVVMGSALGPVFSTCSPTYFIVIATVLPVKPVVGMTYLLAYVVGLCLSLLLVVLLGQKIMDKLGVAADPKGTFKRALGIIFVLVGVAIITGFDKKVEAQIIGSNFFDVTKIEQKLLEKNTPVNPTSSVDQPNTNEVARGMQADDQKQPNTIQGSASYMSLEEKQRMYKKVPELVAPQGFINTDGKPITLAELRGKVVLLDIWTYSCINCQRTLPYVNDWYAKYKDQGLVVVGLHTPEFAFEKVQDNVEKAVQKFGIKYPVVLDNNYATWQALGNQYWPRKYLVDMDGFIVYDHIGEGSYEETEMAIQKALKERAARMGMDEKISSIVSKPANAIVVDAGKVKSPETYFGSARNMYLANGDSGVAGEQTFALPSIRIPNRLYLGGAWNITPEYAESKGDASVIFDYEAKNVYMAAGSTNGVEIEIYRDDVLVKKVTVKDEQLYPLIEGNDYGKHTLRIKIPSGENLKAFTFTFG